VEPPAYLKDVLERMSNGHPMSRLDDLLPLELEPVNRRRSLIHVSEMDAYGKQGSISDLSASGGLWRVMRSRPGLSP
jgi:hypothetical protein